MIETRMSIQSECTFCVRVPRSAKVYDIPQCGEVELFGVRYPLWRIGDHLVASEALESRIIGNISGEPTCTEFQAIDDRISYYAYDGETVGAVAEALGIEE